MASQRASMCIKSTEWNVSLAGLVVWPGEEEGEKNNSKGGSGGGGGDDDDDDDDNGEGEGMEVEEAEEEDTNMALNMVCYIIYECLWRIQNICITNGMWDKGSSWPWNMPWRPRWGVEV